MAAVTPPGQQGAPTDSWPPAARGGPSLAVPFSRLFPTGEVGKVAAAAAVAAVVVPARPVGVAGQPALRSARAAPSPVPASDGGQVPGGRRSLTEGGGGGGGLGGPWDRGPPAQRRPAPGPAGLLPRRRGHGGQREAEAGGKAPEDAAGHDRPPAQPKVLRLRPARPHLREHDGRLLRVHLLLRQPVSGGRGAGVGAGGGSARAGMGARAAGGGRWGAERPRPAAGMRSAPGLGMRFRFFRARVQARGSLRGWGVGGSGVWAPGDWGPDWLSPIPAPAAPPPSGLGPPGAANPAPPQRKDRRGLGRAVRSVVCSAPRRRGAPAARGTCRAPVEWVGGSWGGRGLGGRGAWAFHPRVRITRGPGRKQALRNSNKIKMFRRHRRESLGKSSRGSISGEGGREADVRSEGFGFKARRESRGVWGQF